MGFYPSLEKTLERLLEDVASQNYLHLCICGQQLEMTFWEASTKNGKCHWRCIWRSWIWKHKYFPLRWFRWHCQINLYEHLILKVLHVFFWIFQKKSSFVKKLQCSFEQKTLANESRRYQGFVLFSVMPSHIGKSQKLGNWEGWHSGFISILETFGARLALDSFLSARRQLLQLWTVGIAQHNIVKVH